MTKTRKLTGRKVARKFSPQYVGGPAAHHAAVSTANRKEQILARQRQAWNLLRDGATFEQIGKQLGVSGKTAWYDCVAVWNLLEKELAVSAAQRVTKLDARIQKNYLDAALAMHKKGVSQKDMQAIMLECLRQERQLFGLDAKRPEDAVSTAQVLTFVRDIVALFMEIVVDDAQRQRFAEGLRRRLGPLATPIDVTPKKEPEED